jgi:hypothetical protein
MPPPAGSADTYASLGTFCVCVELLSATPRQRPRYAILARHDDRCLGELRWHPTKAQYVFIPAAQTAWTSRDLSEIALWLRRLRHGGPRQA